MSLFSLKDLDTQIIASIYTKNKLISSDINKLIEKEFPYGSFKNTEERDFRIKSGHGPYICAFFSLDRDVLQRFFSINKLTSVTFIVEDANESQRILNVYETIENHKVKLNIIYFDSNNWFSMDGDLEIIKLKPLIIKNSYNSLLNYTKNIINNSSYKTYKEFFKNIIKETFFVILNKKLLDDNTSMKIFPPIELIYNAQKLCPLDRLRVIIIGQDPYFNEGEAMGLSFSVPYGVKHPSSLSNIFKELKSDGFTCPINKTSGDLTKWAAQGVLLLNTSLTVGEGRENVGKHVEFWSFFIKALLEEINKTKGVAILWGAKARNYSKYLSNFKQICSAHPSGLSAHRGFFGSKPFSKTNNFLVKMKLEEIDWNL